MKENITKIVQTKNTITKLKTVFLISKESEHLINIVFFFKESHFKNIKTNKFFHITYILNIDIEIGKLHEKSLKVDSIVIFN